MGLQKMGSDPEGLQPDVSDEDRIPPRDIVRIKVVSMGEAGVGKSCIIKRYCEEQFVSRYISTIGVDFGVKSVDVNGVETKVNFWDLAGAPEFFEVRNEFYKDTQGAILVYDVSKKVTFDALPAWVKELTKYAGKKKIEIAVCANKTDLHKRIVSEKEGREWATRQGYMYFETSASSGENVEEMFTQLFQNVVKNVN